MPSTNDFEKKMRQDMLAYETNVQAFPEQVHMLDDVVMVASSARHGPIFYTPAKVVDMYVEEREYCLQYFFKVIFFDDWQQIPVEVPWYRVLPDLEATK